MQERRDVRVADGPFPEYVSSQDRSTTQERIKRATDGFNFGQFWHDDSVADGDSEEQPMSADTACIFCRIAAGEIPSTRVYEDEHVFVIRDISPQAPTHLLVIPREHVGSISELTDGNLAASLLLAAKRVAHDAGLDERGYRVATNVGEWGGQSVSHLHLHVLGGRPLEALG